jgi:E3 ubiquitin-protein ligase MYCBP2
METRGEPGQPILLNFMQCPCCNLIMKFQPYPYSFTETINKANQIVEAVKRLALHFAKIEGIDKDERLAKEGDPFFGKLEDLALTKFAFYECFKCKVPYYGGLKNCAEAMR